MRNKTQALQRFNSVSEKLFKQVYDSPASLPGKYKQVANKN